MPRKQNGWGEKRVRGFKKFDGNPRVKKAAGSYPSNRRYGATVTRTVIEDWDSKSPWVRWRKGMEYYYQAAYLAWQQTTAVLFQGTDAEIDVTFDGYRFATRNADSRTHYAIRRVMDNNRQLGTITEVRNNPYTYKQNQLNREVWLKVDAGSDLTSDTLLIRSIGERITDGTSAANIKNVLTSGEKPAIYSGKSRDEGVQFSVSVPLNQISATDYVQKNGGVQSLVNTTVYLPSFYNVVPKTLFDQYVDSPEYFSVAMDKVNTGQKVIILENNTTLPPSLGNIDSLTPIYETTSSDNQIIGDFIFRKSDYQRFFNEQYLTADVVKASIDRAAFAVMPQRVLSVRQDVPNNKLYLLTEPFQATLKLFTPAEQIRYIILDDRGFTKQYLDYDADGNYKHAKELPGVPEWQTLQLDINPWMDETFIVGNQLIFSDIYTCSCPDYLHAKIRSPEAFDSEGGRLNRQTRAPLPTSQSTNTYDDSGTLKVAGITSSWASEEYKKEFKICKHSIASMFINKIRVQEPSQIPSVESRETFEPKLAADIQEVAFEFNEMLKRSEITTVEIVYALAEALNLDDVELGYVLKTAKF